MGELPRLIIVSGPPAAGKSTIAREMRDALHLPLIMRDGIKETFADALGDLLPSRRIGLGAHYLMIMTACELLEQGVGVIVESNFRVGLSEQDLMPLINVADARYVHCTAPQAVIFERYRTRTGRHPIHDDAQRFEEFREAVRSCAHDPMDLGCPRLIVDTSAPDARAKAIAWVKAVDASAF